MAAVKKTFSRKGKSILAMRADEARAFFLKEGSYCNIEFPSYIRFQTMLRQVAKAIGKKNLRDLQRVRHDPADLDDVNYSLLTNKDGKHAWRPFQLIHPALYVSLVNELTKSKNWQTIISRFEAFSRLQNIACMSVPIAGLAERNDRAIQILRWWEGIEQTSIALALEYNHMVLADLTDCYGAIYTHSISWALHGKPVAKQKKRDKLLLGNIIDRHIRQMRYGQTNGIPQGSVLMDFIAELVLGYADEQLSLKLNELNQKQNIGRFKILRFRDDYRIFVDSPLTGEIILKSLTETMIELGLRLNTAKTTGSLPIIASAVKKDKLAWIAGRQEDASLQKHLLLIYAHSTTHPNAGSLIRALLKFYDRLAKTKEIFDPVQLISIAVDIAYGSPRVFPKCAAIVSRILAKLRTDEQRMDLINKIHTKLSQLPNMGHMEVWLQRISYRYDDRVQFKEKLCRLVKGKRTSLWNSTWIADAKLLTALQVEIVDRPKLAKINPIVAKTEIDLFYY